jgi:RNA polymerase sigma-B factor
MTVKELPELPEREMLRLRLEEDLTQREMAAQFGVSQMHVCRLLLRSITKLQQRAVEDEGRSVHVA